MELRWQKREVVFDAPFGWTRIAWSSVEGDELCFRGRTRGGYFRTRKQKETGGGENPGIRIVPKTTPALHFLSFWLGGQEMVRLRAPRKCWLQVKPIISLSCGSSLCINACARSFLQPIRWKSEDAEDEGRFTLESSKTAMTIWRKNLLLRRLHWPSSFESRMVKKVFHLV